MENYDPRNVIDEFKNLPTEEIKKILDERAQPFAVLMQQFQGDFNISTLVRNANIFGAQNVYYIGKKRWDRRGAVGTQNYTRVKYLKEKDLDALQEEFIFIAIEQTEKSIPIETFNWPQEKILMIFGEEGCGITQELLDRCSIHIEITQYGSARSFNAGVASGIAMYDFSKKRNF